MRLMQKQTSTGSDSHSWHAIEMQNLGSEICKLHCVQQSRLLDMSYDDALTLHATTNFSREKEIAK